MRNRNEIIARKPIKPAIYYRETMSPEAGRIRSGEYYTTGSRHRAVLMKTIDLNTDSNDDVYQPKGVMFRRNRVDRNGYKEDLNLRGNPQTSPTEVRGEPESNKGIEFQGDYDKKLGMEKKELLQLYDIKKLRELASEIGGPLNLAHHFKMTESEINQIFPPEKRALNKNRQERLNSQNLRHFSPRNTTRITPNPDTSEVYTISKKMNEKEKRMHKLIFTPVPFDVEVRSNSRKKSRLDTKASRSHIPGKRSEKEGEKMREIKNDINSLLSRRTPKDANLRVSHRLGKVKELNADELMEKRLERMRSKDRRRNRVRGQPGILGNLAPV